MSDVNWNNANPVDWGANNRMVNDPAQAGAAAAPQPTETAQPPVMTADVNTVNVSLPPAVDMGPLPWADAPASPVAVPLSETQQKAFDALSKQQQDQFATVARGIGADHDPAVANDLLATLTSGALTQRDALGGTLLNTLASRVDQPLDPRMATQVLGPDGNPAPNGNSVLQEIVHDIAHPDGISQGVETNTCVAASTQTYMATEAPAEYARLAAGLAFDGRVQLPNSNHGINVWEDGYQPPRIMTLDDSGFNQNEGRSPLEDAIQCSFTRYAIDHTPPDAGDDEFGGGRLSMASRLGGGRLSGASRWGGGRVSGASRWGGEEAGGLTASQANTLFEQVVGVPTSGIRIDEGNQYAADRAVAVMNDVLASGLGVPVGMHAKDGKGQDIHHMISVDRVGKDPKNPADPGTYVFFRDSNEGREMKMSTKDFKDHMEVVLLPSDRVTDDLAAYQMSGRSLNRYVGGDGDGGDGGGGDGGDGGDGY